MGWSVRHGAHVDVPAHAEKGRTCRSGGSSQSRVDILLATTTTGQRLDFKQPCCLRLTAANPIPQRPHPSQQHRTIRNKPRTAHREETWGLAFFCPCNLAPRPPPFSPVPAPAHPCRRPCSKNGHHKVHYGRHR